jgi:hypothetical protein
VVSVGDGDSVRLGGGVMLAVSLGDVLLVELPVGELVGLGEQLAVRETHFGAIKGTGLAVTQSTVENPPASNSNVSK